MKNLNEVINRYFFLILSILTLLIGLGYFYLVEFNSPNAAEAYFSNNLQIKIENELKVSDASIEAIKSEFSKSKKFKNLKINSKYPYYIFKNGEMIFWSDYRYVPDYKKIRNQEKAVVIKHNQNFSLFNFSTEIIKSDTIKIISLINLYKHYQNENDYLQSSFNDKIFHPFPEKISIEEFAGSKSVTGLDGKPLFYYQLPINEKILESNIPTVTLWILSLAILFFTIFIFKTIGRNLKLHQFGTAIILLLIYGIFLRAIMITTGIPLTLSKKDFLNPSFYNGDFWAPSLGDTIINALFILIFIVFVAIYYFRSRQILYLLKSSKFLKSSVSVLCVLFVVFFAYFCSQKIQNIYSQSLYKLGFSLSINFDTFKIITLAYYFIIFGLFFIGSHICINLFLRIQQNKKAGFFHWLYGFVLSVILLVLFAEPKSSYILAGVYFLLVYYFKLSRYFYSLKFPTLLYFILGGFFFTLIAVERIQEKEFEKNIIEKRTFGYRYLADNDLLGEGLLDRFSLNIKNDEQIISAFNRKNLPFEAINQLVKDQFLDLYFDKYEVDVLAFDSLGNNLDENREIKPLNQLEETYQKEAYKTSLKNLFFINETGNNFIKQYVSFNSIYDNDKKIGTVILDLKQKDGNPESVYPELLLDKKYVQNPESKNYSYAIFDQNNKLLFNQGSFNYLMHFTQKELQNPAMYNKGISYFGFSHLGIKGENHRTIIVSQVENYWKNIFSNFSFLFLLSILGISFLLMAFAIVYGIRKLSMNFSTKIQLYLNAAFLLPLIIIIVLTMSVVRSTLVSIQEKSFLDNTKNIANSLQMHLDNYLQGKSSRAFFEKEINDLARNTKVDINFYNKNGKLNLSTRPLVYQYKLISEYLNPLAYSKILEEKENEIIAYESLGSLNFKTVYIAIKGNSNNNFGVIGIPFFDAKTLLDQQVKEVVTTILIIFLVMFMLLLILSYFASDQLTSPLKLIASRIKRTNLDKLDETLEWKSNDEIGLLTKSYNKMIKKLDESKVALSQSEKQTAWREMAKQVAHEIKNPLTPMKLSIQQLQRTLPMDDPKSRDRIERALNSLTEQIDNISEIANSFSEFAKMPVPRNEKFDLVPVVQKTTDLYSQNNNIKILFESKYKQMFVNGDRLLVSRVITNLILNGIQSVPPLRQPEIKVKVYKNPEENFGIIEVSDNGEGIPEDVRKKVFIPNFSTKVGGSGLGLAMAKRGIEHAGGNIWFETEEGVGTIFFIDLPIS